LVKPGKKRAKTNRKLRKRQTGDEKNDNEMHKILKRAEREIDDNK
jgi:hypothetical protein